MASAVHGGIALYTTTLVSPFLLLETLLHFSRIRNPSKGQLCIMTSRTALHSLSLFTIGVLLRSALGQTGDSMCNSNICVTGIMNGSTTTYELLAPVSAANFGWMAMGFGTQMPNSPLVVMWPNEDGTITLSQRMASDYVMPTVVPNPPRVASLVPSMITLGSSQTRFTYTIPSASSPSQNLLWSMSPTRPSSSAVDATLVQHTVQGTFTLDLSKTLSSITPSVTASFAPDAAATSAAPNRDMQFALTPYDRKAVIHAVLASVGFAVLMPLGSLWNRWARTFIRQWFLVHYILNFWIALPIAVAGFALGVDLVNDSGVDNHFDTIHKKVGLVLLILVGIQWVLGLIVHYVKPAGGWSRRPFQNYVHAFLGIGIIGTAFYNVYAGFTIQWPLSTGLTAPTGIKILWVVWISVVALAYLAGFALLPRQFKQEKERRVPREKSMAQNEGRAMGGMGNVNTSLLRPLRHYRDECFIHVCLYVLGL